MMWPFSKDNTVLWCRIVWVGGGTTKIRQKDYWAGNGGVSLRNIAEDDRWFFYPWHRIYEVLYYEEEELSP